MRLVWIMTEDFHAAAEDGNANTPSSKLLHRKKHLSIAPKLRNPNHKPKP